MRVSLNWLKEYVDIKVPNEELIRLIGARLVEVEGVIDETHKYDGIVVVRVEKAEPIPDTHLTLCQINDSGTELIQVVCGAPNVREGMLAAWIKPGAIVPASVHEDAPFVIGKRKMLDRYDSCGMLAGADELDFDDKHEKIVEIDPAMAKPGDLLADVFGLNDLILEIENKSLTHRPDTFGIIGFAREVAGILGQKFNDPEFLFQETVFPEGFLTETKDGIKSQGASLAIEIADTALCPRYSAAVVKVIDAEAEEKYLSKMQVLLAKSGMMTKSKIVDVTNYLMLLTGQPLHAFDYDKFLTIGGKAYGEVKVRAARVGEKIVLLDDTEVALNENDIVICSGETPVALAGAMGGKSTAIDESTKNVLLESASFSLYNLRKTQMAHGIFSEAITRFTKGVPAGGTFNVLAEAVREIGARPLEVVDKFPQPTPAGVVKVTTDEINALLGTQYAPDLIIRTLEDVGFQITVASGHGSLRPVVTGGAPSTSVVTSGRSRVEVIRIRPPYWRTDIHIKEDIIEEVGRLLGYDNIAPTLPLHATASKNPSFELKSWLRDLLAKYGANEVLTYSFVSERLLDWAGQDAKNSYKIINSISPELQYVRQSLVPSLLDKTYLNEKLPVSKFAIFEINQVYRKEWGQNNEKVPVEKTALGMVIAERKYNDKTAFYQAKKYAAKILDELNISAEFLPLKSNNPEARVFEPKRSAEILVDGEYLGVVGEFKNSVRANFKLAEYLAGFEMDFDLLLAKMAPRRQIDFGRKIARDLTVITKKSYADLVSEIQKIITTEGSEATISPVSVYQADNTDEKHISVRLEFSKFDDTIMEKLEKI